MQNRSRRQTTEHGEIIRTEIPARLDRLPWSRWHWLILISLGAVWILDGLEVTIVGAIAARLGEGGALGLSEAEIGMTGTGYIVGAALGALVFGHLTDRFGRKKLFLITLGIYLAATVATAAAFDFWSFAILRFLTGLGIGGEYAAINSAIDELIPARARGWADLGINGSYWLGAAIGAGLAAVLLNPDLLPRNVGWRLAFGLGAILGLCILLVRRRVPESPRWMMLHGHVEEAEKLVRGIEEEVQKSSGIRNLPSPEKSIEIRRRETIGFATIARTMFRKYPKRSILGFVLMGTQAFVYNAILFTHTVTLTKFFEVSSETAALFMLPFGLSNFVGALALGRLFDTIGRRAMISITYTVAAVGFAATAFLFGQELVSAPAFVALLCAAFFFASPAASAAYLTVSEIFPLEIRAMAIAFFYAIATGIGGAAGPALFGRFLESQNRGGLMIGYLIAAGLMAAAAVVELIIGVKAERQSLETLAQPLSAETEVAG